MLIHQEQKSQIIWGDYLFIFAGISDRQSAGVRPKTAAENPCYRKRFCLGKLDCLPLNCPAYLAGDVPLD